jgi:hypothetical protein
MKVCSVVVLLLKRELMACCNMVVYCVVVLLVVMEWMATITGDLVELFLEFSQRRKILADHFLRGRNGSPVLMFCFCIF